MACFSSTPPTSAHQRCCRSLGLALGQTLMRPPSKRLHHVQGDSSGRAAQQRLPVRPFATSPALDPSTSTWPPCSKWFSPNRHSLPYSQTLPSTHGIVRASSCCYIDICRIAIRHTLRLAHLQILQACRPSPDAMCPDARIGQSLDQVAVLEAKVQIFFLCPTYPEQRRAFVQYFLALAPSSLVAFFFIHTYTTPAARRGATCAPPAFDISRAQSLP